MVYHINAFKIEMSKENRYWLYVIRYLFMAGMCIPVLGITLLYGDGNTDFLTARPDCLDIELEVFDTVPFIN